MVAVLVIKYLKHRQPWRWHNSRKIPASNLRLYSLSGKTSYRKISWSLEAARFGFKLFQSLWNLAGTSAALLPSCLLNFRAIRPLQHPISRLRGFTRFGGKTSYRLVNRGPGGSTYYLIEAKWCIYASINYANFGSDNGLSPVRRQSIIWTNAGILKAGALRTYFSQININIW